MTTRRWPWRYDILTLLTMGSWFLLFPVFNIIYYPPTTLTVAVVAGQLVLMVAATVVTFRWLRRRERKKWAPTSAFPPVDGEAATLEGRIHELTEHLEAPWSNRRCVAWCMARADREAKVVQWCARAFVLEDLSGRGRIVVDPSGGGLVDRPDLAVADYLGVPETSEQRARIAKARYEATGEKAVDVHGRPVRLGAEDPPPYEWSAAAGDVVTIRGQFSLATGAPDGECEWPAFTIFRAGMERGAVDEVLARRGYHYYFTWFLALVGGTGVALVTSFSLVPWLLWS